MRLSCLPVSYFRDIIDGRMGIKEWALEGSRAGLDGIDLSILFLKSRSAEYLDKTRHEIEETGIRVAMVTTYPDFTHPDSMERERELTKLKDDIVTASRLGADLVRVTAGQAHPSVSRRDGINWAVNGLTRAMEFASGYPVKLAYENHAKPGAWQYTDFSHPTDIFLEIVERTASIALGVNWDTANTIAYGDDPIPILKKVLNRVVSVHAADTSTRGELKHVLLGTGLVPFKEMFQILRDGGFDAWICIEEASFKGPTGVRAAADFVRRIWNETAYK
ncbi:MAG TPA: sugar phosphate isomerase/epimerase family protein [Candidatus Acidoferrum sp.]|nr:sugar phosphate isomerase/epimerase family protein [Candidatus Acidoferrum sp.]